MHTDATRAKISASKRGKKLGPQSPEHRRKIAEALIGRLHSVEHRAKIADALKGRKQSSVTVMRRVVAWRKRLAMLRSAGAWVSWSGTTLDFPSL